MPNASTWSFHKGLRASKIAVGSILILTHSRMLQKYSGLLTGIILTLPILVLVQRSDRAILERQGNRNFTSIALSQYANQATQDEKRIANLFIADTLPKLMKKGLIKKYVRDENATALFVVGPVWKDRTRFVKESLLTAVSVFNKVNGYSVWTLVLDDCDGTLYAQILPTSRKEIYN